MFYQLQSLIIHVIKLVKSRYLVLTDNILILIKINVYNVIQLVLLVQVHQIINVLVVQVLVMYLKLEFVIVLVQIKFILPISNLV